MKTTLAQAIALIPQEARVFVHGGAATPNLLLEELIRQADRFSKITFIHLHTEGPALYADPKWAHKFHVINLFVGRNIRRYLDYDRIDYLPCFLSEIPQLFRSGLCPIDVALLQVSPVDRHGHCSLGVSVDIAKAAFESAKIKIAQVNPQMPRVHGDGIVSAKDFSALVEVDVPIFESCCSPITPEEASIARYISSLIEDGSTLQMGVGSIPNGITDQLQGHKNLGLHTEMWSDGALSLLEKGVINNSKKKIHRGKSVSGFMIGSRRLYDYVDDNSSVIQLEIDYVNHPNNISRNDKVVAINSAVEVDLTGQICADSVGHRIISGVGGQMDFMRGAALSKGGKPIIALQSTTAKGQSKIVFSLKVGAGVVTTRSHTHYVVTEYGVAYLYGKALSERAKAMIAIAHPSHRENLEKEFFQTYR